jgi:hypothetical protein
MAKAFLKVKNVKPAMGMACYARYMVVIGRYSRRNNFYWRFKIWMWQRKRVQQKRRAA